MHRRPLALSLLVGVLSMACAAADETRFYLGASAAYADLDEDRGDVERSMTDAGFAATARVDDTDFAWKVFAGYKLNAWFGVEAGYVDLGKVDGDFTITAPVAGRGSASADVDGFAAFAVARYPVLPRLDVFGKIGAFVWDVDGVAEFTAGATRFSTRDDDNGVSAAFGLGAKYDISDTLGLRVEWERYADISEDDNDADLFSIGFEVHF